MIVADNISFDTICSVSEGSGFAIDALIYLWAELPERLFASVLNALVVEPCTGLEIFDRFNACNRNSKAFAVSTMRIYAKLALDEKKAAKSTADEALASTDPFEKELREHTGRVMRRQCYLLSQGNGHAMDALASLWANLPTLVCKTVFCGLELEGCVGDLIRERFFVQCKCDSRAFAMQTIEKLEGLTIAALLMDKREKQWTGMKPPERPNTFDQMRADHE